ncbi:MAG TPA: hypothetical protein VKX41_15855 [Alloacidobacterium sp.]|nr:hypothetical protein [Alloacidobacterium sp.]
MHLNGLDLLFWAAGFGAHLILLFVLLIRYRFRQFPIFTAFILANVLRTVVLYLVQRMGTKANYFYTFWSLGILDMLLQISVVYEMYSLTFRPLGTWAPDTRAALKRLGVAAVAVAAGLTWLAAPRARLWIQVVVIKGSLFSSALMTELFVGMIALSVKAGLPWKTHVARISQGLGFYSMVDVLVEAGHSYYGVGRNLQVYTALSQVRMSTYLICVFYWAFMLWREAPAARKMPKRLLSQLIQLNSMADSKLESIRVRK